MANVGFDLRPRDLAAIGMMTPFQEAGINWL
jgi:hypothetical protein